MKDAQKAAVNNIALEDLRFLDVMDTRAVKTVDEDGNIVKRVYMTFLDAELNLGVMINNHGSQKLVCT